MSLQWMNGKFKWVWGGFLGEKTTFYLYYQNFSVVVMS